MERSEPGHRPEINSAIYSPTDVVLELSGEVEKYKHYGTLQSTNRDEFCFIILGNPGCKIRSSTRRMLLRTGTLCTTGSLLVTTYSLIHVITFGILLCTILLVECYP